MKIGIDGNMWYCSNGLEMMDQHSIFTFERTLREAVDKFRDKIAADTKARGNTAIPSDMEEFLDYTPEEYRQWEKDNGQFGVGA